MPNPFDMIEGWDSVALHDFPETGRGLQALHDIPKHHAILSAPPSILWTSQAALTDPILGPLITPFNLSTDDTLAIHLLYVKHSPACTDTGCCVGEELEVCRGTSVYGVTGRLREQIGEDFGGLVERLFGKNREVFPLDRFTLEEYTWALLTVYSRAMDFNVPASPGVPAFSLRCIVPYIDMVNHSGEAEQCHLYDQKTGCVKIVAGKDFKKGDQIFINYGPVSNSRLLRLYGFVIPNNPHDTYDLILTTHPLAPFFSRKLSLLLSQNLTTDATTATSTFSLSLTDPLPEPLVQYLRIQRIEDERDFEKAVGFVGVGNERVVVGAVVDAVWDILEGMGEESGGGVVGSRRWSAGVVVESERRILKATLEVARKKLRELDEDDRRWSAGVVVESERRILKATLEVARKKLRELDEDE
ncbi:hypothetical protein BC829DRAFT_444055 [Chytridium lagenaria]|nr:hypothetical protein BC829DRAFT_444055 [Chytridium lagenaria]